MPNRTQSLAKWTVTSLAAILLAAGGGSIVGGCAQVLAPGTTLISYDKGGPIASREVPADGEYALYSKYGNTKPMHVLSLTRGDALGFRTAETGKVTAVAGDHEYLLTDTSYVWNRVEP